MILSWTAWHLCCWYRFLRGKLRWEVCLDLPRAPWAWTTIGQINVFCIRIFWLPSCNFHSVFCFWSLEPDMSCCLGQAALDHSHKPGVRLSNQGIGPVHWEYDHINRWGMVGHAYSIRGWLVLRVMKGDLGWKTSREAAENCKGYTLIQPSAETFVRDPAEANTGEN